MSKLLTAILFLVVAYGNQARACPALAKVGGYAALTPVPVKSTLVRKSAYFDYYLEERIYQSNGVQVEVRNVRVENKGTSGQEFNDWVMKKYGIDLNAPNTPEQTKLLMVAAGNEPTPLEIPGTEDLNRGRDHFIARDILEKKWSKEITGDAEDKWHEIIDENVDFALEHYPRRGWKPAFFSELKTFAKKYADGSTYITVRDPKSKDMLGTLRFISTRDLTQESHLTEQNFFTFKTPDVTQMEEKAGKWAWKVPRELLSAGHLPMEEGLGIELERPILVLNQPILAPNHYPTVIKELPGEIIEPGNFAMKKGTSPKAMRAIALELLKGLSNPNYSTHYNSGGRLLYTYGDDVGVRLYRPFGFQAVDESHPIQHGDREWWVLRNTSQGLKDWVEFMEKRPNWEPGDEDALYSLLNSFNAPLETQSKTVANQGRHGLENPEGYIVKSQEERDQEEKKKRKTEHYVKVVQEFPMKDLPKAPRKNEKLREHARDIYSTLAASIEVKDEPVSRFEVDSIPIFSESTEESAKAIVKSSLEKLTKESGPFWKLKYLLWQEYLADERLRRHPEVFLSLLKESASNALKEANRKPDNNNLAPYSDNYFEQNFLFYFRRAKENSSELSSDLSAIKEQERIKTLKKDFTDSLPFKLKKNLPQPLLEGIEGSADVYAALAKAFETGTLPLKHYDYALAVHDLNMREHQRENLAETLRREDGQWWATKYYYWTQYQEVKNKMSAADFLAAKKAELIGHITKYQKQNK